MISILYALVFPYIFLLFDCFEWALIDCIVKCKVHSVALAVSNGGVNLTIYPISEMSYDFYAICTGISLYIPIM